MALLSPYISTNNSKYKWIEFTKKKANNSWMDFFLKDPPQKKNRWTKGNFRFKDTHRLKAKRWQKISQTSKNQKKERLVMFIWNKINFKPRTVTSDKKGHYRMIKRSIHQEDVTIINIYQPNNRTPKYINIYIKY